MFKKLALIFTAVAFLASASPAAIAGVSGGSPTATLFAPALKSVAVYSSNTFYPAQIAQGTAAGAISKFAAGIRVDVNVSAVVGDGTLVVKLQQVDPVSGAFVDEPGATTTTISTAIATDIVVYPGIATSSNRRVNDSGFGQGGYRVVATVGGTTGTVTFSVGAVYLQ